MLLAVAVLATVAVLHKTAAIDADVLLRDPAAVARVDPFTGAVSSLGIVAWAMAAGVWLSAVGTAPSGSLRYQAVWSLGLTLILMLDDLFMLHENVLPRRADIHEAYVLSALGFVGLAYGVTTWRLHLGYFWNSAAIVAFFAISLSIDQFSQLVSEPSFSSPGEESFFEDGAKWIGINLWLLLAIRFLLDNRRNWVVARIADSGK